MDSRYVKSLLAVIEAGSISKAAQLENLTAAAMGQRISTLEAHLKVQLLERSRHSSRPTRACQRMMPQLRAFARNADDIKRISDPQSLSGCYRLGMVGTALADYARAVVSSFHREAPMAELLVSPGSSVELYGQLIRGELDSILVVKPPFPIEAGFRLETTLRSPTVFIFPEGHQNNGALPLLLYDKQAWGGSLIWDWLCKTKDSISIQCEMDEPSIIANLVAAGLGAAYLPYWRSLEAIDGITIETIHSGPIRELAFIHHNCESALDTLVLRAVTSD